MFLAKKLLSALILPPAGPILLAFVGLWLAGRKSQSWRNAGRWLVGLSLAGLLLLSIPVVARSLAPPPPPPVSPADLARGQAIVVLGGGIYRNAPEYGGDTLAGAGLERVRYGAWLARQAKLPVLVSGGAPFGGSPEAEVMARVMGEEFGVPPRWVENASRDTAENARLSAPLLRAAGVRRIVLVSHASHLPRAAPLFSHEGFEVIAAPTLIPPRGMRGIEDFLPGAGALRNSSTALHERLGHLYNQLTGAS